MAFRLNKGFSLLEVIIAVGVISVAAVFIFRSFRTAQGAESLSHDIIHACFLAEDRICDARLNQSAGAVSQGKAGTERIGVKDFFWRYAFSQSEDIPGLRKVECTVSWDEAGKETRFRLNTYQRQVKQ